MRKNLVAQFWLLFVGFTSTELIAADFDKPGDLLDSRIELAKGVYKTEIEARRYERSIISFWDSLRESESGFSILEDFPFNKIELPAFSTPEKLPNRILESAHRRTGKSPNFISFEAALGAIENFAQKGYKVEFSEWFLIDHIADDSGNAQSIVRFEIHVDGPEHTLFKRVFNGELEIVWQAEVSEKGIYLPDTIAYKTLTMRKRSSVQSFEKSVLIEGENRESGYGLVLVDDVDNDGDSDILFPRSNKLMVNNGDFDFRVEPFYEVFVENFLQASAFADIDLDGTRENIVADSKGGLFVYYRNSKTGKYDKKPKRLFKAKKEFRVESIAVGDLNGDMLPDIFLAQSRLSHLNGYFPDPYFNANNGRPSYLLINKGDGRFEEEAAKTAIKERRNRNVFSSSIFDLNADGRMDLLTASQYAGLDAYLSNSSSDLEIADSVFDEPRLSAGGHVLNDFNGDGHLDLFVSGRTSNSLDRLLNLGLSREGEDEYNKMREIMASGNRLYFGDGTGRFAMTGASEGIASSGWSWGCAGMDFNNDGFDDLMVANGNISRATVANYDSEFWTYDIYDGMTSDRRVLDVVFDFFGPKVKIFQEGMSWNGFEANRMFLNVKGEEFIDISYFMGVADSGDGRALISEDFNLDGRVDFLVVSLDQVDRTQKVSLYENKVASRNNWIGIRLKESKGKSIMGTRVRVESELGVFEKVYTLGNVYSGTDSSQMHFGIGRSNSVKKIDIVWPDGATETLEAPEIGKYHVLQP
ncbi:CRTAC1 family protein [Puniceicoccaceae bacterium K14]|nr:CRTAC1 family protein [Puniceicoccaceae bacterium K14]